jgi:hypothetical protein
MGLTGFTPKKIGTLAFLSALHKEVKPLNVSLYNMHYKMYVNTNAGKLRRYVGYTSEKSICLKWYYACEVCEMLSPQCCVYVRLVRKCKCIEIMHFS